MRPARTRIVWVLAAAAMLLAGCYGTEQQFWRQRAALSDGAATSDAEAVFAEAYRLEQKAAFGQALQYYTLVIDRFPASPLVPIAQERVKGLAGQQALGPSDKTALSPGDYACTVDGLYPNRAGWCGRVRQMRYPYYLMEISDLRLNAWYAVWLGRSTCTGDRMLSWFSQGDQIWVPRTCLAEPRTTG